MDLAVAIRSAGEGLVREYRSFCGLCYLELLQVTDSKIELLTCSNHDGWTIPVSLLTDEDGEINPKLFINRGSADARLKRAANFWSTAE